MGDQSIYSSINQPIHPSTKSQVRISLQRNNTLCTIIFYFFYYSNFQIEYLDTLWIMWFHWANLMKMFWFFLILHGFCHIKVYDLNHLSNFKELVRKWNGISFWNSLPVCQIASIPSPTSYSNFWIYVIKLTDYS